MDWNNVNMDSLYERSQCILDGYDFESLFTEISCNIPKEKISESTIRKQFEDALEMNINSAREVFEANLKNILKEVKS